eukprot:SAG31_NODE_3420_length_4297_cov_4.123294_3_plen_39_part_00
MHQGQGSGVDLLVDLATAVRHRLYEYGDGYEYDDVSKF